MFLIEVLGLKYTGEANDIPAVDLRRSQPCRVDFHNHYFHYFALLNPIHLG
jgi:hypothetical protein